MKLPFACFLRVFVFDFFEPSSRKQGSITTLLTLIIAVDLSAVKVWSTISQDSADFDDADPSIVFAP